MLCESMEAKNLLPFVDNIFNLKFEEKPDYDKLRFYLLKGLLDIDCVPNQSYDWNVANCLESNTHIEGDADKNISRESYNVLDEKMSVLEIVNCPAQISNGEENKSYEINNQELQSNV